MASCGPPGNRSKILVNCPKCQSDNTFLFFLPWICCPFFFCVESTVSFFPSKQPTNNRGIHPHLDPLASVWWASEPIPPKCRWHAPCSKQLRPLCQLVEREGFIRGVLLGIWKLMSWMSRNICFFEFLNPFIFLLRKWHLLFPGFKKIRVKKWWSPSWEFKDGPCLVRFEAIFR